MTKKVGPKTGPCGSPLLIIRKPGGITAALNTKIFNKTVKRGAQLFLQSARLKTRIPLTVLTLTYYIFGIVWALPGFYRL